jgi:Lon-like ATP-dependent protease
MKEQYDMNKEKNKATEKLYSIYENLKNFFDKEKDEKKIQIERFHKNLEGKTVPEHILKIINEEIERFNSMDKHSMESNVIRNYLDILTGLPYGITTEENMDIEKARKILDESHYGMEDIKERILECIAVGNLKGKIQGKILCFVGPPGVGKTSIGESIANSLNRKFMRISVGGDRDTSTLKGFRRTYIGAIPGKIVKALKVTQTENPVILIDEVM